MFSEWVSTHFTGRFSFFRGVTDDHELVVHALLLAPKPPPTAGAMTRSWVLLVARTAGPGSPAGSWGRGLSRGRSCRRGGLGDDGVGLHRHRRQPLAQDAQLDSTRSAPSNIVWSSPMSIANATFEPCSSNSTGASSAIVASASTTAGSGS